METSKTVMTPDQAAAFLGISDRTLSRWHLQRVGPPRVKIGGRVLYRREALLEWLIKNEQVGIVAELCAERIHLVNPVG